MRDAQISCARWFFVLALLSFALPAAGRERAKAPTAEEQRETPQIAAILDHIVFNEKRFYLALKGYSPRVETYLQYYEPQPELGDVPTKDAYFLGRLKLGNYTEEVSFLPSTFGDELRRAPRLRPHLRLNNFAMEPLSLDDDDHFDRQHYKFEPVRWEYLGDVRCLALDVSPRDASAKGVFKGRIWVEDHDYAIVRLNGTRLNAPRWKFYVHFECWRENLQPGLWLPVYVFSQESDISKRLRYKAETRLWGYDLTAHREQQEWTNIMVEAPAPVHDNSEDTSDYTPLESHRQWTMEAEQNVLDRLEKARLVAPPGPVDKVLETVINNLRVTNHLDNLPPIHCRVTLTSTLESFSLAYTIVLSRGLIDVLPDEPSLAMVLSHELAHIALGHKLDTKYAFSDRMQVSDEDVLSSLDVDRPHADETTADAKGIEYLKNSPYKDNLAQAGLFLRAAVDAAPRLTHLFGPHMGNGLTEGSDKLIRMAGLMTGAPALVPRDVNQIAALPMGSRIQVNPWGGTIAFTQRKSVALVDASEKLPFRITPIMPYLRPYKAPEKVEVSAKN